MPPLKIIEIISRSSQGVTRPFLCRGENGEQYYVKGHGAGCRARISEWIGGYLGACLGLPIPSFTMTEVPDELIRYSARYDLTELGRGVGFGSQLIPYADELTFLFVGQVESNLRARILLFDWWIRNSDRTLNAYGGNVNLLWTHSDGKIHVIDQNSAFDGADMTGFWDEHVFRDAKNQWTGDFINETEELMRNAIMGLSLKWQEMPEEWTEVDTGITLESLVELLSRFERDTDRFWKAA